MAKKFASRAERQRGARARPARARNELRIIGGAWRGRRIRFAPTEGLRPSPDRVRETLFNWLRTEVIGSRCLDLFAGSGALGIEALSRGAAATVFVDRDPTAVRTLAANLALLGATTGEVLRADALQFLRGPVRSFDIVFLDPPFASGGIPEVCALLAADGWLAPGAHIYIEQSAREPLDGLPAGWTLVRSRRAGEVGYHLARSSP
jgi:16S rRNA (guanine966-N2)-methyltransferase